MHPYDAIRSLALKSYRAYIRDASILRGRRSAGSGKLRLLLKDGSFMDIFFSGSGKYSFHWERRKLDGMIYRFDNAPHHPKVGLQHLHEGAEDRIVPYTLLDDPIKAFQQVMEFVKKRLQKNKRLPSL
jgi:hypothetical protein